MLRTHNCGELGLGDVKSSVTLCGWVQKIRDKGRIIWIDLRDRYGITQLIFEEEFSDSSTFESAKKCGREFVIKVSGEVSERLSKNPNIPTGDIEIRVNEIEYLNISEVGNCFINRDFLGTKLAPQEIQAMQGLWASGAISQETLLKQLAEGEILGDDFDVEMEIESTQMGDMPDEEPTPPAEPDEQTEDPEDDD